MEFPTVRFKLPGTTRDVLEIPFNLGGFPIIVTDTAGLRETEDEIETEGVRRALNKVKLADVAIVMIEAQELLAKSQNVMYETSYYDHMHSVLREYLKDVEIHITDDQDHDWLTHHHFIVLLNKVDLLTREERSHLYDLTKNLPFCPISLQSKEGLEDSMSKLKEICSELCSSGSLTESPLLTTARHRTHIESCLRHINNALGNYDRDDDEPGLLMQEETLLLAAQQLQLAASQLGAVSGYITNEDVLDEIFSSFCIGK